MKKAIVFLLVSFYLNAIAQCVSPTLPGVVSSSSTICSGQSTTLTITSGSLNSATNWFWYTGGCGSTAVGSGTQIVVNPATSTTYFARGEGSCVIPGSCASLSMNVLPSPNVTATQTNPACFGQSSGQISLFATGPSPFTYSWSNTITGPMLFGQTAGLYTATITGSNGCKTYTTVNITQPSVLVMNVSPSQTICFGNIASVYVQGTGGTSPYNYTLTNQNTSQTTNSVLSSGLIITPTLTSTTTYAAVIKDANGCANGPLTIIVNVKPPLIAINSTVVACDRDSIVISPTITSTGNGGPYTYSWINNSTSSNSVSVIASLTNTPQNFSVSISDGCTTPSTSAVITVSVGACVGIMENKNADAIISFYPNPVKDILIIESEEALEVKLLSLMGQELLHKEIKITKNILDVSALNNGIYLLSFYSKKEKLRTEKIIVAH